MEITDDKDIRVKVIKGHVATVFHSLLYHLLLQKQALNL